ncbi:MAG: nuclease-related domain-containing protein [Candidatus Spyradenecus sp.]
MLEARATMRGVPGDAARRRGLRKVFIPILAFGTLFGVGIGAVLAAAGALPWPLGALCILLAIAGFFYYSRTQPTLVYGYFKGARGEEIAAGELSHLPDSWTVFNGLLLPNGRDIDHVAVGPQGVFVIETKHWSGEVSIDAGQILANGRPIDKSPILQVRHALVAVAQEAEIPQEQLHGVLCFIGHKFENGPERADEILVCSHLSLVQALTALPATLSPTEIAQVVSRLGRLDITEGL